jgi:hypothetical protein
MVLICSSFTTTTPFSKGFDSISPIIENRCLTQVFSVGFMVYAVAHKGLSYTLWSTGLG